MKAKVKATGEIVDVVYLNDGVCSDGEIIYIWTDGKRDYLQDKLDFNYSDMPSEQRMMYELTKAAISTAYKRLACNGYVAVSEEDIAMDATSIAKNIIKKLKEIKEAENES